MGILTGFRAVEENIFERLKAESKLKSLLDYLEYREDTLLENLNLSKDMVFPSISLDKGWDEIGSLLEAASSYYAWDGYGRQLDYQPAYAFYWSSRKALDILSSHYYLCLELSDGTEKVWKTLSIFDEATNHSSKILGHDELEASFALIKTHVKKYISEKTVRSQFFSSPHDEISVDYVLGHYEAFIEFLMKVLISNAGEFKKFTIIGFQS